MTEALKNVRRAETGAAVLRGYDETDAQLGFGALEHTTGCVALAGFPAGPPGLDARKQAAAEIMRATGTDSAPATASTGGSTATTRCRPSRGHGAGADVRHRVIVDTMEVAGLWSAVPRLYDGVETALSARAQAVACHLSHLYPSGSSLYFTFLITGADDHDAETRYREAWQQAARACTEAGGTITHHHGVGRLKAPFLAGELGNRDRRAQHHQKSPRPGRDHEPERLDVMTSPFGPLVLIANPNAGRGTVDRALPRIESVLADKNLSYRIVRTTHPGHATEAARQALRDGERYLVAVGGDGTVHEVVNGMVENGGPLAADAVLGVVAAGSGCDFVRSFGLPGDAAQAAAHLAGDQVPPDRRGHRHVHRPGRHQDQVLVDIAKAGLGGAVVARAAGLRAGRFLGGARYAAGFWLTLPRFRPAAVRLDATASTRAWRAFNVVVANCRFYGGGMQISPNSDPGDCLLDILVMTRPKSDSFTTLPKVYKGAHLPHRDIAELQAAQLNLEADPDFPVEADGELLGTTPASFGIIPGALRLKV